MSSFSTLQRHRRRLAKVVLTVFVTTWAALAWQPCVHAMSAFAAAAGTAPVHDRIAQDHHDGMTAGEGSSTQPPCLHCPPDETINDHCGDAAASAVGDCVDIEQSAGDSRAPLLLLPLLAPVPIVISAPVVARDLLPPGFDEPPDIPPSRSLILTFGVLLR